VVTVFIETDEFKTVAQYSNSVTLHVAPIGSTNINLERMKAGFAWYFKRYAAGVSEIERFQYEAAETEERESKRGPWQQQQAMPPLEWLYWREGVRLLA